MRMNIMAAAFALLAATSTPAQEPESPDNALMEIARANTLEITRTEDGRLTGEGWERLIADAASAQFFMIGEQHATADIAEIETAIYRGLVDHGFNYMAVELGPWSTRYAETLIRESDDYMSAIRTAPGDGYALPFLFFAEDAELVQQVVRLSPSPSETLWGVDQEFVAAAPLLIPMIEALARTDAQHAVLASFDELAASNPMAIGAEAPDLFAALRAAFDTGEDDNALEMVDAIILSNRIYRPFMGSGEPTYPANLLRENYMKRNFVDHFERIERRDGSPPRVFLKFGANHVMRGRSLTNVPAMGDFIVEWGRSRDFRAVNILIDCLGGEATEPLSGATIPCESYMLDEGSLLARLAEGQSLTLIDLRPLRAAVRRGSTIDAGTRDLIFAFDYYLGVADVSAATLIPPPMQLQ